MAAWGWGCLPVVAQETEPVPLRALGVPRLSSFYDADGDGVKEFYDLRTMSPVGRYHWQAPGCYGWEADVEVPDLSTQWNRDYGKLLHVNNDGIPDFSGFVFYDISPVGLAVSRADGSFRLMRQANSAYPLDVNHDGLIDLFSFNQTDWNILYQTPDGSFTATRIDTLSRVQADSVVAQKMEENNGKFDLGDMSSWLRAGMFVGGSPTVDESYKFTQTLDVNRDGLMDLVGLRTVFYNLGDNRFVASPQPGELTVKDLNGDGIPDYIYNDTENQRVYTRVYLGNEKFREQTLVKDLQVTDIHCYDFDRDGDVDLLLTFDYLDSSSFSFLLFAENTGGGQFTLHEHSFAAHWAFGTCLDFDNDGYMELLAGLQEPYYGNEESSASVKGLYLFRLNDMAKVEEPEEPLVNGCFSYKQEANSLTDWKTVVTDKLSETVIVADVDNDGYLDVLADTSSLYKDSYDPKATVGYWSARTLPLLKGALANEAPERMAVPTMILDRKNGRLKLAWKAGKDKETSTVDLTYALRIGSAPGKDDIYFSGANADGSRRDFLAGNMGANLETTLDVSRWKHGIYYISIQTVDPMGKGSVWSEELVYEHRLMQAAFAVSDDEPAAADTLVLTAAPRADGLDYAWDFDGGKAIKASADSAQVWLTFDVPGEKHLRLTVRNPEDGTEDICEQWVTVQRVSFEHRASAELGLTEAFQFWDMDGDGALDVIDKNGFYLYNGTGGYEKLGTIFNSNLLFHASVPLNEDGTLKEVDIRGEKFKGRALLDKIGMVMRSAFNTDTEADERQFAVDYFWYLWCGKDSPLFDKDKMTTFERYFLEDKDTHTEEKGFYYKLRDDEKICDMILNAFGVKGEHRHIINGHVPVRVGRGETPIKANGKLMVIDGGFAKAYHNTTGIAGYTLVFHSRGFQLVQHEPFTSAEEAIKNGTDIVSTTQIVEMSTQRMMVRDTDKGKEIASQIEELKELLYAYRHGYIKESTKDKFKY